MFSALIPTLILATAWSALSSVAEAEARADQTPAMMGLDFQAFDKGETGWRSIARGGCYRAAAEAINRYRSLHDAELHIEQLSSLEWHEGQMLAHAGDYSAAIERFQATFDTREAGTADRIYAEATIAFLNGETGRMHHLREALAVLPPPEGFDAAIERFQRLYPDHPVPTWPLNLAVVDRLIHCAGASYAQAYAGTCEASED